MSADGEGLERFVEAQRDGYDAIVAELRAGRKTGHWIWYVFPQLVGLGRSGMSEYYGIRSLEEARRYLAHSVLGPRLRECAELVLAAGTSSAESIFGSLDALKVRSSMTLFHRAAPDEPVFRTVLDRFYDRRPDDLTDRLLADRELRDRRGGASGR